MSTPTEALQLIDKTITEAAHRELFSADDIGDLLLDIRPVVAGLVLVEKTINLRNEGKLDDHETCWIIRTEVLGQPSEEPCLTT